MSGRIGLKSWYQDLFRSTWLKLANSIRQQHPASSSQIGATSWSSRSRVLMNKRIRFEHEEFAPAYLRILIFTYVLCTHFARQNIR